MHVGLIVRVGHANAVCATDVRRLLLCKDGLDCVRCGRFERNASALTSVDAAGDRSAETVGQVAAAVAVLATAALGAFVGVEARVLANVARARDGDAAVRSAYVLVGAIGDHALANAFAARVLHSTSVAIVARSAVRLEIGRVRARTSVYLRIVVTCVGRANIAVVAL